ncbi:MAG: SufE family protein [Actinobacteria bacterium]|nr:SufE family protein [Actinomycetota bacterium]
MLASDSPSVLDDIATDFNELSPQDRLTFLLEFANELPELPPRYAEHPELLERVEECQSPVYIFVEVDAADVVGVFATAPREAPTTRGFASILVQGLTGLTAAKVLNVADDFPSSLGLNDLISPLRVRGMTGMLWRIKRQIKTRLTEATS